LLLAIAQESLAHTREFDPVTCPVCGDKSVFICASHHPSVDCLISGKSRLSEEEYLND